ncbi:MAG: hypothetical protein FJZ47_03525 [Candidatus Tectomicrobia bacterium]|uniref:PPM-type phosphatase domain-containing protein n=1 Tax=Tectimicrobiota bacterium TaxID=2528274 RepID=A0A937VXI2_UNCTE|nr:hypothetical protein [Candidatus Tectomicrobia bacterium]
MLTSTVAILHDNEGHGEDHYVVRALDGENFLDAVMDGVTGRRGWEASEALATALMHAAITSPTDLLTVLEDVNQQLYRRGWGRFLLTTLSAVFGCGETLHVVGAGDSPILLIRPDTAQLLASRTSGFGSMGPMRAIGATPQLGTLYRAEVHLEPGDRLLLATDGVTDTLTRDEVVDVIRTAVSPEAAVQHLHTALAACHARASVGAEVRRDDWTAIVRFFHSV